MRRCLVCLVALAALSVPAAAQATTIVVNTTAPEALRPACGLISAVAAADANAPRAGCPAGEAGAVDRIEFALPALPATIQLEKKEQKLQIAGDVEIVGPGTDQLTVSGGNVSRVFEALNGTISISGLTVAHGKADELGGGMYVQGPATVALSHVALRENEVEAVLSSVNPLYGAGGAIMNEGNLTLTESTVTGNVARNTDAGAKVHALGGGIANGEGRLLLDRSTVSGNLAIVSASTGESTARGGGIYNLANLTVRGSTVNGNEARIVNSPTNSAVGGGIAFETEGPLLATRIERSTIAGNTAVAETLSQGGGIAALGLPGAVSSSTIVENSATSGANVLAGVPISFANTIVARPLVGASCVGVVESLGFNLDEGLSCGFAQVGDQSDIDPGLAPALADNGGPTATLALLNGSPAIDTGFAPGDGSDQRGFRRPVVVPGITEPPAGDGADIGAFEIQAPRVTITRGPAEGETVGEAAPIFEFTADGHASGFLCAFDGAPLAPCTSPLRPADLANGAHTFSVLALGEAGYQAEGASRRFNVDVKPKPDVPVTPPKVERAKVAPRAKIGKLPRRTMQRQLKIRFSATEAGSTFQCKLDGRKWRGCSSPYVTPRLSLGKHAIRVRAIGTTGLLGTRPATRKFRVVAAPAPG